MKEVETFSEYTRKKVTEVKCPKFVTSIRQEIEEMRNEFMPPEEPKEPSRTTQQSPTNSLLTRSLSKGGGHISTAS